MSLRLITWLLSMMLHASLALAFISFGGDTAFEAGSGDDLLQIEQGIAIEGLDSLGQAPETVEAIEAQPLQASEARPEIEEVKAEEPVEEVKPQEIETAQLPDDTEIVASDKGPEAEAAPTPKPEELKTEEPRPSQTAALEQVQQTAVDEQRAAGAAQSGGDPSKKRAYFGTLRKHLERKKVNPRTKIKGTVVVRFTVAKDGRLLSKEVVTSSGSKTLDDAAVESLERAAPFPPFPAGVADEPLVVAVPFRFLTR